MPKSLIVPTLDIFITKKRFEKERNVEYVGRNKDILFYFDTENIYECKNVEDFPCLIAKLPEGWVIEHIEEFGGNVFMIGEDIENDCKFKALLIRNDFVYELKWECKKEKEEEED